METALREALNNLGNALRSRGNTDESIAQYRRAIDEKSNYLKAHINLGRALQEVRRAGQRRGEFPARAGDRAGKCRRAQRAWQRAGRSGQIRRSGYELVAARSAQTKPAGGLTSISASY